MSMADDAGDRRWADPYAGTAGCRRFRGNLHCHSTHDDGSCEPAELVRRYRAAGYDFLTLSHHDLVLSTAELAGLNGDGLLVLPGSEITADAKHVLAVGVVHRIEPHADRQRAIDAIIAAGGFAVACHPHWQPAGEDHISDAMLMGWQRFHAVEVYNGIVRDAPGNPYAVDKWIRLLDTGRRVWAVACDDTHLAQHVGRAWIDVWATDLSVAAIADALHAGRCVASTGVRVERIELRDDAVHLESDAAHVAAIGRGGRRLAERDDGVWVWPLPADEPYVFFELWGRGDSQAWTQPFFACPSLPPARSSTTRVDIAAAAARPAFRHPK